MDFTKYYRGKNCDGSLEVKGLDKSFSNKQKFIDSEVIRLMKPYTPLLSGTLQTSPNRLTDIGSGEVIQRTPYARKQYYDDHLNHPDKNRGAKWFEVMKTKHKKDIEKGAIKVD